MEISFNSTERVVEYMDLEQEPDNPSVIPPPEVQNEKKEEMS